MAMQLETDLFGEPVANSHKSVLARTFDYPPFSVLNAREGWWQERKRQWLALGIKSELGRGGDLIPNGGGMASKERYAQGGNGMMAFDNRHGLQSWQQRHRAEARALPAAGIAKEGGLHED